MTLKFKSTVRNTKRIGISGKAGCGKSTAIVKATPKPLVYDLERKWTREMLPTQPIDIGTVDYDNLKSSLLSMLKEPSLKPYDTLWIDSASELGRLCENHAIEADYGGKKSKYSAFASGPKHELIQYFTTILRILGDIEDAHKIDIGIICHVDEGLKLNAMGEDYDKILLDVNKNLRPPLLKWFDYLGCVYDKFEIKEDGLRHKVSEGGKRLISFDPTCPLYDAKCASMSSEKMLEFDIKGDWYRKLFNKKEEK